jgi:CPA1 family monovalent cation:H+ antiporter
VGAPARLIRLVEGEALLNDAAAIAILGVLLAMLTGHGAEATLGGGLRELARAFGGGVVFGLIAGRIAAFLLPALRGIAQAEAAWTLALPYPLYLVAENVLDVSGVVAVVCAGLVVGALGRTRLTPRNWQHLQLLWAQIAALAGAVVFLLAAVRVPELLHGVVWQDVIWLAVVVAAAMAARLAVLFGLLPALAWFKLSAPVSHAYKLAIAWGGLRGAVTLVLALGVAENHAVHPAARHFVTILATGFVLVSVLFNGATLRWVMRWLGLAAGAGAAAAGAQSVDRGGGIDHASHRRALPLCGGCHRSGGRRVSSGGGHGRGRAEPRRGVLRARSPDHRPGGAGHARARADSGIRQRADLDPQSRRDDAQYGRHDRRRAC